MKILTTEHYTAFGLVTHCYASVEFGIKATLGGILELPFIEALIIAEPYSAAQLKNVAKSLAKESLLSKAHQERFVQIVGDWSGFSSLRNQIAHCRWQKSERPGAIRAVGVDIRSGTAKWIVTEETRDWTAKELMEEALKLTSVNERLQKLHEEAGIQEIMERKDAERNTRREA